MSEGDTLEPAPTPQPALPGIGVFSEDPAIPEPKTRVGVYVDKHGEQIACEIVADRPDGSVDILIRNGITSYRRDSVRRQAEGQTGDFLK